MGRWLSIYKGYTTKKAIANLTIAILDDNKNTVENGHSTGKTHFFLIDSFKSHL